MEVFINSIQMPLSRALGANAGKVNGLRLNVHLLRKSAFIQDLQHERLALLQFHIGAPSTNKVVFG